MLTGTCVPNRSKSSLTHDAITSDLTRRRKDKEAVHSFRPMGISIVKEPKATCLTRRRKDIAVRAPVYVKIKIIVGSSLGRRRAVLNTLGRTWTVLNTLERR
ncbi:hypothetical protein Bbelb_288860 [Branchiostoma belcheri]|nr:hypothetical protein Bbelb_288860 [Branchiostoma belcheri]